MLVIHPDECIDCGVCEPECPAEAIKPDTEPGLDKWLKINTEYAEKWPNITIKRDGPADGKDFDGTENNIIKCQWENHMTNEPARREMVRKAMKAPYLEREEEHSLAVAWKDNQDQEALHKITTAHMRLVISMASKFRNFGLPMSDLVQEGYVGLLEAAARFEPAREVRFSTYATWWIRASMQDYILRNWSIVRGGTSSAQKALFFNLRRLRAKLARNGDLIAQPAIYQEISQALGVSEKDVALMDSRLSGPDTSLCAPVSDDEAGSATRMDFLVDNRPLQDTLVEETIDGDHRTSWLNDAMHVLNERELHIIRRRRLSENGATLEALGIELGVSKERVRQIENRALEKMKIVLVRDNRSDLAHFT
ncbi:RNA polymerase sigma factor RpoH [Nymphon striatum]|nr:RNA polymerase sigma factor RpoH [Nymphon striatum]